MNHAVTQSTALSENSLGKMRQFNFIVKSNLNFNCWNGKEDSRKYKYKYKYILYYNNSQNTKLSVCGKCLIKASSAFQAWENC